MTSVVNGVVMFPAEPYGYQGLFPPDVTLLGNHARVDGKPFGAIQPLAFPLLGEAKAGGARPSIGI